MAVIFSQIFNSDSVDVKVTEEVLMNLQFIEIVFLFITIGTWSNSTGLATAGECTDCSGGQYCDTTGLTSPTGPCAPGYYCAGKSITATPNDTTTGDPCTVGHYCPEGTAVPIPCPDGKYMTNTGAAECWNCTPGHYCITGLTPDDCPPGYYCPEGTGQIWESCPLGTFSTSTGLWDADNCTQCTGGWYCDKLNATTLAGKCNAGYYCTSGSNTPTPDVNNTGVAGPCPTGHYCPQQTTTPQPCPLGTFNNVTKLTLQSQCTPCSYGKYCGSTGLTEPTGDCWAGFYCLQGAQSPNNPVVDSTGGPCPIGSYCPNGTSYPLGCPAGTYNPSTGLAECIQCPAGYYCPENSTTYTGNDCPKGHYCLAGTGSMNQYPCSIGTYNDYTGKQSSADCVPCEPGKYCATPGLSVPTGDCTAGWYCVRGAWSDQPADITSFNYTMSSCFCPANQTGGKCQPGEFCPTGSDQPQACLPG